MRITRTTLCAALLALTACSSSSTDTTVSCGFTFSGAVAASTACTNTADATYNSYTAQTTLTFGYGSGATATGTVSITFGGVPTVSSHASTATDVIGGVQVTNALGGSWATSVAGGSGTGSFTLSLTSVSSPTSVDVGISRYTVHGTLVATIPATAGTGSTGTLTVNATF